MAQIQQEIMNMQIQNQFIQDRFEAMLVPADLHVGRNIVGTPAGLGMPNPIHALTAQKSMPAPGLRTEGAGGGGSPPFGENRDTDDENVTDQRGQRYQPIASASVRGRKPKIRMDPRPPEPIPDILEYPGTDTLVEGGILPQVMKGGKFYSSLSQTVGTKKGYVPPGGHRSASSRKREELVIERSQKRTNHNVGDRSFRNPLQKVM